MLNPKYMTKFKLLDIIRNSRLEYWKPFLLLTIKIKVNLDEMLILHLIYISTLLVYPKVHIKMQISENINFKAVFRASKVENNALK